jgi:transposase-like protein
METIWSACLRFKREAVRLALSSDLPRKRVANDLGVGLSTLGSFIAQEPSSGYDKRDI